MGRYPAVTSITIPSDKRAMRNDELVRGLKQLIGSAWDINHLDATEILDEIERRLSTPTMEDFIKDFLQNLKTVRRNMPEKGVQDGEKSKSS